jgi:hypothetical protein
LCKRTGTSGATIGCIGGLDVRSIFTFVALPAAPTTEPARAARVPFPTGSRADFDAFLAVALTVFAPFFAVRLVLVDRPAAFVEFLLISSI